jgi:hypothetical protein
MGIVKSTMDDQPLDGDFRKQFEELIDDSIADAYDEYEEEPFSSQRPYLMVNVRANCSLRCGAISSPKKQSTMRSRALRTPTQT